MTTRRPSILSERANDPAAVTAEPGRTSALTRLPLRLGILSFSAPGHVYPLAALGRALKARGHQVTFFQVADLGAQVRASGVEFCPIGAEDFPPGTMRREDDILGRLKGMAGMRFSIERVARSSRAILRDAPAAIRARGLDALVVDQAEYAGGAVAEHLGLPFVNAIVTLPFNLDPSVPVFCYPWVTTRNGLDRLRNQLGNAFFEWLGQPVFAVVNRQRRAWGLAPVRKLNEFFSPLAQISQLPAALELPGRRVPPHFHYTGPWTDGEGRAPVDFPWERLDPARLLVYASMGTLQNGILRAFRMIAEACAGLDLQLVISLGRGQDPAILGELPGDPIVVGYAPQLELVRRASLTISHAGVNTVLESLSEGVPVVVLPVTNDHPGMAARVMTARVGQSIPIGAVTVPRLRQAIDTVLGNPSYCARARYLQAVIAAGGGAGHAAEVIETALLASRR
ncbi:MAG: nucleotide disphospho-sugar-binding domain-containing protein [Verrucomicrobiota bacterium]